MILPDEPPLAFAYTGTTAPNSPSKPSTSGSNKSERIKRRNHESGRKNKKKRKMAEKESGYTPPELREGAWAKYDIWVTQMETKNAPVARTGYISLNRPLGQPHKDIKDIQNYTMDELRELGFKYIKWEGE